jgi:hypothetical protein
VPGDAGEAQAGSAGHDGVLDRREGRQVYQKNVVCPLFTYCSFSLMRIIRQKISLVSAGLLSSQWGLTFSLSA